MTRPARYLTAFIIACATLAAPLANAALIDRGGGLIYDTDRDVTWLQDANYAQTSGYDTDGLMNWSAASAWADQLVFGGSSDWRLPTTTDVGLAGCSNTTPGDECAIIPDPSTSEWAHVFYVELGNTSYYFEDSSPRPGGGLTNVGPFINLKNDVYWGGTPHIGQNLAYIFEVITGRNMANFVGNPFYATAVTNGDVGAAVVPLPASVWLLGTGVAAIIARRRRRV
jgi:hypothetical protein